MVRTIIHINEQLCNGCGDCAAACHEGAIGMVNGKARLLRDDYCDGLGDCLPSCPTGAITFVDREAAAYDETAVAKNMAAAAAQRSETLPCGCPGTQSRSIERSARITLTAPAHEQSSELNQWPVQIKLVPINAPYFSNANLLIAADCTAYAYGGFHRDYMRGRVTLIGCPKLDDGDYADKLTAILAQNDIKSVTVARMEVPCCGGLEQAVRQALSSCGKLIPWQVITIGTDGSIINN